MKKLKVLLVVSSFLIIGSCGVNNTALSKKNKNWLEGQWTGLAFQIDIKEDNQWTIQLEIDIQKETYNITYPSLSCSGRWELIKYSGEQATFNEIIENNTGACIERGTIILFKIDDNRVLFSYFYSDGVYSDGKKASAFATLEKKSQ